VEDDELAHHAIKFLKCVKELQKIYAVKNRSWPVYTIVYYGPPGTGKTKRAQHEAGPDAYWLSPPQNGSLWWDGYNGEENVVIDEFNGHFCAQTFLQRVLDRYPMRVPTKGDTVPLLCKRVWITSNVLPTQWYKKGLGALHRRLSGDNGVMIEMPLEHYPDGTVKVWRPDFVGPRNLPMAQRPVEIIEESDGCRLSTYQPKSKPTPADYAAPETELWAMDRAKEKYLQEQRARLKRRVFGKEVLEAKKRRVERMQFAKADDNSDSDTFSERALSAFSEIYETDSEEFY